MSNVSHSGEPIPAMDADRLRGIVAFVQAAEKLKDTLRSGLTSKGRPESVAEHSWRLCLMVMLFGKDLAGCDLYKLLKLCVVHDLGEAISGDVPANLQTSDDHRAERERSDLIALCTPLPEDLRRETIALWDEYAAAQTPEAVLAKGFDKLETLLQHVAPSNASVIDYAFNLTYGIEQTAKHPLLAQLRALVDEETRAQLSRSKNPQ